MPLSQFSAPGRLTDFNPQQAAAWSEIIYFWINNAIDFLKYQYGEPVYFFNELDIAHAALDAAPIEEIFWDGFPRSLRLVYNEEQVLQEADRWQSLAHYYKQRGWLLIECPEQGSPRFVDFHYRNQDEYLEWFVTRHPLTGAMEKITFTCEAPEYWRFIGNGSANLLPADAASTPALPPHRQQLLDMYRTLVSPQVRLDDLLFAHTVMVFDPQASNREDSIIDYWPRGTYNPFNQWNTTHGLIHLTHPANTLKAQVQLAALATILRHDHNGCLIKNDAIKLLCCSGNGQPNRSSDPTIVERINTLVRQGIAITLPDPVGLYIHHLDTNGIEGPNGEDTGAGWRIVRGREGMILRAEFQVPADRSYGLEDIRVDGEPLRHGGQLATKIKMFLQGKGFDFGAPPPQPHGCTHCCTPAPENYDYKRVAPIL
ncbi:MAG: hypothetical protein KDJ52_08095 [Anaerolineae bacterium]|nr:hypothetical protein [Anaerolineae bacterium]